VTRHYFGPSDYHRVLKHCSLGGQPLLCRYTQEGELGTGANITRGVADALWFHAPSINKHAALPDRAFPGQIYVVMSMESAAYYHYLSDPKFMSQFDLTQLYTLDSDVPNFYPAFDIRQQHQESFSLPTFEERIPAVMLLASNCASLNKREKIAQELRDVHQIPFDSMGLCMHNMAPPSVGG
jgi:hypothetical protein